MVRGGNVGITHTNSPRFYCERQSGGLCRMHALNVYFGAPKLTRADFEAEIADFDAKQKARGHDMPSANSFDVMSCDHKNIIAHILAKHGVFVRFYEPTHRDRAIAKMMSAGVAFVYNPDHIWLVKQDAQSSAFQSMSGWYKIDSLSGVTRCEIAEISRDMSLGLMIPTTNLREEFDEIGHELNELVMPDIIDYLIDTFHNKKVIGNAETLIGAACAILELQNNGRVGYTKLDELFEWYIEFTRNFHDGNCASLKFILQNVPQIIARIISIWRVSRHLR
jgi:hypothetical protein